MIKTNLGAIDYLSEKIKLLDAEIAIKVKPFEEDINIILSVPGIGLTSAATILAEMGDYRDFPNADKLTMVWGRHYYEKSYDSLIYDESRGSSYVSLGSLDLRPRRTYAY
ncbi:MAG: transposase, partial [Methanothrix sp.]